MDNQLVLGGHITAIRATRKSPAGIPITQLTLEHRSTQQEASYPRLAQCRIKVMVCGKQLHQNLPALAVGQQVRISGFISRANNRQGEAQLVLHAVNIEPNS